MFGASTIICQDLRSQMMSSLNVQDLNFIIVNQNLFAFMVSEPHNLRFGFSAVYFCPILTTIFKIYRHHLQVPLGQLLNHPLLPLQGYILYHPSLYTLVHWCFLSMYVCMFMNVCVCIPYTHKALFQII
jgi:hypothetical protein